MATAEVQRGIVDAITRFWTDKIQPNPQWGVEDCASTFSLFAILFATTR